MLEKLWPSADSALKDVVKDGMLLAVGGFGLCGVPETLIEAAVRSGACRLTVASNNADIDNVGLGKLLETRQIAKMTSSYVGETTSSSVKISVANWKWSSVRRARWRSGCGPGVSASRASTPAREWELLWPRAKSRRV